MYHRRAITNQNVDKFQKQTEYVTNYLKQHGLDFIWESEDFQKIFK
jgi:hypothetical protein